MGKSDVIVLVIMGVVIMGANCVSDKTYIYQTYSECYQEWGSGCSQITLNESDHFLGEYYHTESWNICDNNSHHTTTPANKVVRGGIGMTDSRVHA